MPISAFVETTGKWIFGPVVCWAFISADVFLCTSSIWNLVIISLERCMAISWPLFYGPRRTKGVAYFLITIAWIVSFLICIPPLFLKGILEGATAGGQCHYSIDFAYRIYSGILIAIKLTNLVKNTTQCCAFNFIRVQLMRRT